MSTIAKVIRNGVETVLNMRPLTVTAPECEHWENTKGLESGRCKLGLYGGNPTFRNCLHCMTAGHNNEAYAAEFRERMAKAWPDGKPRISGCCDRADQA